MQLAHAVTACVNPLEVLPPVPPDLLSPTLRRVWLATNPAATQVASTWPRALARLFIPDTVLGPEDPARGLRVLPREQHDALRKLASPWVLHTMATRCSRCALGTGSEEACLHTKGGAKNSYGYIKAGCLVCSPGRTPESHMWFFVLLCRTSVLFIGLYACACPGRLCCWSRPPPRTEADPRLADRLSASRAAPRTGLVPPAVPRSRNRARKTGRKIPGRGCPPTVLHNSV